MQNHISDFVMAILMSFTLLYLYLGIAQLFFYSTQLLTMPCLLMYDFLQDLIIFPDDVEYKRVPQCTTGRVYILKFKSSSRKFFFWMQVLSIPRHSRHSITVHWQVVRKTFLTFFENVNTNRTSNEHCE